MERISSFRQWHTCLQVCRNWSPSVLDEIYLCSSKISCCHWCARVDSQMAWVYICWLLCCLSVYPPPPFNSFFPVEPGLAERCPVGFFFHLFGREFLGISCTGFLQAGWTLSPKQQCWSTEGNCKHWWKDPSWSHHFLIHHRTPEERVSSHFVLALQLHCHISDTSAIYCMSV